MNPGDYGQRPRAPPAPPNGAQIPPGVRMVHDHRNGMVPPPQSGPNGITSPGGTQTNRAERFEDEKKRIIESCFGKKEPDGSLQESYITHIRIEEDAEFPSSPPPASSRPENKKQRVIIVAVRKSGRVRMHKARENVNGTFSIGKTWQLDDLTVIESYANAVPANAEEQQNKQRAGVLGFTVTIQKPYYWAAGTAKEKEFFIFSLIKIFKKYTGGRLPELIGFSTQEIDQFGGILQTGGAGKPPSGPQPGSQPRPPPIPPGPAAARVTSQEPIPNVREPPRMNGMNASPPESSRERRHRPSQERPSNERILHSAPGQERTLLSAGSQDRPLRKTPSSDRMYVPGAFPSTESVNMQNSQPQLRSKRSESPGSQTTIAQQPNFRRQGGSQPDSLRNASDSQPNHHSLRREPSNDRFRPNGSVPPKMRSGSTSSQRPDPSQERPTPPTLRSGSSSSQRPEPPPTLRSGSSSSQRPEPSQERPSTAVKDALGLGIEDPRSMKPPTLTNRSYRSERSAPAPESSNLNGEGRAASVSRRGGERAMEDSPSLSQSESSGRRSEDTRPTTASSQAAPAINAMPKEPPSSFGAGSNDFLARKASTSATPTATPPPPESPIEPEPHRPGLGPMIKKKSTKEIASTFRRAATAANAFKPRAGGAVEKLKEETAASGGDGITGVFQAPSLSRGISQEDSRPVTPAQTTTPRPSTPLAQKEVPAVQVTGSPAKQAPSAAPASRDTSIKGLGPELPTVAQENPQEERRKRRRSDHSARYAKSLGLESSLLESRIFEIEDAFNDFGWADERNEKTTFEDLQTGVRKDLAHIEAGSWLGTVENNDDRTAQVGDMLDRVMAECEELDCLLTLYNVELGTLREDVAYIEAQSQGLQVQTANQKLLHTEVKNLLDTISISSSDLFILKDASLSKTRGVLDAEHTLAQLYAAMLTIDPRLRQTATRPMTADQASLHRSSSTGYGGSELSSMAAVRERREGYRRESIDFIQRLKQYMSNKFQDTESQVASALERKRNVRASQNGSTSLDHRLRDDAKRDLYLYSPLMLFAREIEPTEWDGLLLMYEGCAKKPYLDEFRDNVFAWKRITRKPVGDEQDLLFTTQEKESESIVGRKLTVKRAKTVRADGTSRISSGDKPNDGKVTAYEAFAGALSETARLIFVEQNFIVDLFHASSLDTQDFIDAVAIEPERRIPSDVIVKKPFDPDRDMARKVTGAMEEVYSFWPSDVQNLVDWAVKQDPLNSVGVLFALESQLSEVEETNQEFLSQAVSKIHDRLVIHFTRFVEEQIRGIEDTKVKIKKRKGVIAFMKTFPNFSTAVENMLPPTRALEHLPIRGLVNDAYQNINKSMFESMKFLAKENPSVQSSSVPGDPEDKEALNHHILVIENMNHYVEEVSPRSNAVLEDWNFRARAEMSEHMNAYLSAVIRRPLGKLLDFLESTETLVKNTPQPPSIATRASHSRSVFKKILGSYDAKEIRRGVETLKKRVEKHFGEGDDSPGLSKQLVVKVLMECESRYTDVTSRVERVVREVYEGSLEIEWRREDVSAAFRR